MNILIATIKSWNIENATKLSKKFLNHSVKVITKKDDLNKDTLDKMKPDIIFFPHWSWIIPKDVYTNYECIVFHMTDLPFGRGGSPLQNLISRGIYETKISAIKVDGGIDTGNIYMKDNLGLYGSADEILIRSSNIIFNNMIPYIIHKKPIPKPQQGQVFEFKRRKIEDGDLSKIDLNLNIVYDYIRMLDGEGYHNAYLKLGSLKLKFSRASLKQGKILADVEIVEED